MEGSGGVVFGQDGMHQNSVDKVLRRHQDVEAMAAVLHTGLQNLRNGEAIHKRRTNVIPSLLQAGGEKRHRGNRRGSSQVTKEPK